MANIPDFRKAKVLVIGDVMLDRFWHGSATRMSPEAPVPVVNVGEVDDRPGGAGNVAVNLAALGVSTTLSGLAGDAAEAAGATVHRGGTYLAMEGPQFSSRAESLLYRQWGCDVIGMTNMPEAKLAREAELPYATIAMVTDYDCWHDEIDAVSVTNVLEIMQKNTERAKQAIRHMAEGLNGTARTPSPQGIETCLDFAVITAPSARDPALLKKLDAVAGRVL